MFEIGSDGNAGHSSFCILKQLIDFARPDSGAKSPVLN
jgi:hypothetical protein